MQHRQSFDSLSDRVKEPKNVFMHGIPEDSTVCRHITTYHTLGSW